MSSYHYSLYSPHGFHCCSIFSHRFHRSTQIVWVPSRGCTCLKCTNQARSAPTKQNRYSPTESTEPTELLAECILPQISQICTDCLGAFKGVHLSQVHQPSKKCTNRARSAPTKQNRYSPTESTEPTELLAECILPQIAQIYTEVRLPSRGCTCLRSALPLARARSAPTKQNRYSPTESTEPTELLAECILPQISQIYTDD